MVISNEQAKEWDLTHLKNIYGDEVNYINCRSIWKDEKGRNYRVELPHMRIIPKRIDVTKQGK
jgi:hypothetical protein